MKIAIKDAVERLVADPSKLFIKLFEHGSMTVEFYKPGPADFQTPHTKDELYLISSGSGEFIHESDQYSFKTGDLIFVPAGDRHRFQNYTPDFGTWVIFYGREGGEMKGK